MAWCPRHWLFSSRRQPHCEPNDILRRRMALTLTADERTELDRRTRSRKIRAEDVYRPMESAIRNRASRRAAPEVSRTSAHGAHAGARGARAGEDAAEAIRRQQHWTTRNLANVLGISHMLVARVWRRAGYQPHRCARHALGGSAVRGEGGRWDRALPESAAARRRLGCG